MIQEQGKFGQVKSPIEARIKQVSLINPTPMFHHIPIVHLIAEF